MCIRWVITYRLLTLANLTPVIQTKFTQQKETLKVRLYLNFSGMFVYLNNRKSGILAVLSILIYTNSGFRFPVATVKL